MSTTPNRGYPIPDPAVAIHPAVRDALIAIDADVDSLTGGVAAALADPGANGIVVRTSLAVTVGRTLTGPAAGLTISNSDGVSGNPTFALANDLSALEALSGTGFAKRTGSDAWTLASPTASEVGLGNVTNDVQTKASIVPNTLPASGHILVGNAGGTAYAPVSVSGDITISDAGVTAIGAAKVTNAMLAGSIAASKLVGTDIATVGTLTAGATGAGFTLALSTSTVTGTLADARLSSNVPLKNAANAFTEANTFTAPNTSANAVIINSALGGVGARVDTLQVNVDGTNTFSVGYGDVSGTDRRFVHSPITFYTGNDNDPLSTVLGNYFHGIRNRIAVTGNPNAFDKWEGITSWVNLYSLDQSTNSTQDFYAFNGECAINDPANTFNVWTIYGIHVDAGVKGSGNINDGLIGVMGKSSAYGSGTITKHRGTQGWVRSMSGATGTSTLAQAVYGVISNDASGHTMTTAVAVDGLLNSNAGTIGNAYVIRARAETSGAGTVSGNRYGVYIADQNVGTVSGTVYNLYSAGSARLNHIEGELRVGGLIKAGSGPTTLTDSAGKILSAALNTVAVAQGGTGDTGTAWTTYTPTITAATGTFTSVSATGRYKTLGKTVFFSVHITITTNGTAAGLVLATLPVASVNSGARHYAVGQETAVAGFMLFGIVLPNSTTLQLAKYDATYPGASGYVIDASGSYESA